MMCVRGLQTTFGDDKRPTKLCHLCSYSSAAKSLAPKLLDKRRIQRQARQVLTLNCSFRSTRQDLISIVAALQTLVVCQNRLLCRSRQRKTRARASTSASCKVIATTRSKRLSQTTALQQAVGKLSSFTTNMPIVMANQSPQACIKVSLAPSVALIKT